MIRRKLTALIMCIMSLNLVACSNTDSTQISKEQIEENTVSSEINKGKDLFDEVEINKEKELFDKAVIIADDDIARVKMTGKEKVTPGNSIGYIFSISNKSNKKIAFYMKNITINIESLDELKNAKGTFCIEVNDNVNEYKFEIE